MANHITKRTFKVHHNKSIGTVIFVVEGESDEIKMLRKIFYNFLNYKVRILRRNSTNFKDYTLYASAKTSSSQVLIVNTSSSSIKTVREHDDYRKEVYKKILDVCKVDPKNSPIYYIWDRDCSSNEYNQVRNLVCGLGSAYDNKFCENGLLLLSYPALEAYKMSCLKNSTKIVKASVKKMKKSALCKFQPSNIEKISFAARVMHSTLCDMAIVKDEEEYIMSDFSGFNKEVFKKEEKIYEKQSGYRVLSLITIALLDLGILEIT